MQGELSICTPPDVYVVFGRPKGYRGSWKQWEENNTPMTVVFEVLSPGNDPMEMADKHAFYDEYGVEEYYVYDPDRNTLRAYLRGKAALRREWKVDGFVSPRLGIRFDAAAMLDDLEADHGARPADRRDRHQVVALGELIELGLDALAHGVGAIEQLLALDHVEHRQRGRAGDRVAAIGAAEAAGLARVHDLCPADHARQREAAGE